MKLRTHLLLALLVVAALGLMLGVHQLLVARSVYESNRHSAERISRVMQELNSIDKILDVLLSGIASQDSNEDERAQLPTTPTTALSGIQLSLSIIDSLPTLQPSEIQFVTAIKEQISRIESQSPDLQTTNNWRGDFKALHDSVQNAMTKEAGLMLEEGEIVGTTLLYANQRQTVIALMLLLVCFCLSLFLAGRIAQPLEMLKRATERIASGDLNVQLIPSGNAETRGLAEAFNKMIARLKETTVSRQFLIAILNAVPDGITVLDEQNKVEFTNEGAKRIAQLANDEKQELNDPEPQCDGEPVIRDLGGRAVETRHLALPHPLSGRLTLERDITAERNISTALGEARERLAKAERAAAIGTLGAIVAHKLSQPISSVRLFLQQVDRALTSHDIPEAVRQTLKECMAEVGHVSHVVKQMIGANKRTSSLPSEQVDLAKILNCTIEALQSGLSGREAKITLSLGDLPKVPGVAAYLEEAFYILIHNSIQARDTEKSCTINISSSSSENNVKLRFEDSGIGIPADHLDNIFDYYFTTKTGDQGTGLGLAILKQIMDIHRGSVEVSSTVGQGAVFELTFPRSIDI